MKKVLEVNHLTKYYGKNLGVEDLSISLEKGEIFGFIGPNGAGKSTTIRSIMGMINKTDGQILINGMEFNPEDIAIKEKLGYLPSEIHLYDDFTVKQMLDYHASFYKKNINKRRKELVKLLKIDETKKTEDLSLGNLKKVGIVLALMHEPSILILDEPTSGLDPIMQEVFYELLLEEKKKGTTILYSTHILSEVSKICDHIGIIKDGHLILVDEVSSLIKNSLSMITIISKEISKIKKQISLNIVMEGKDMIKCTCQLSSDEFVKAISKFSIDRILIEEPTLEDIVLNYYQ